MSSISVVSRTAATKDRELYKTQFTKHSTIEEAEKALQTRSRKFAATFRYFRLGIIFA